MMDYQLGKIERRAQKKKEGEKRAQKKSPPYEKRKKRALSKEKKNGGKRARAKNTEKYMKNTLLKPRIM